MITFMYGQGCNGYHLCVSNTACPVIGIACTGPMLASKKQVNDGKWHHTVGVWEGSGTMKYSVIVDGAILDTGTVGTSPSTPGSGSFCIAQDPWNNSRFVGAIDDIRIYDRALSGNEINALYHENGWVGNP